MSGYRVKYMEDRVSEEKLDKYKEITGKAIDLAEKNISEDGKLKKIAEDYLDMAKRYFEDSKHFRDKGDYVTAFAALNYAHGFLDAGARIKAFKVKDDKLFASD